LSRAHQELLEAPPRRAPSASSSLPLERAPLRILLGRFGALASIGLKALVAEHDELELLAEAVDVAMLEASITSLRPQVVLLDEAAMSSSDVLARLSAAQPAVALVVLSDRLTSADAIRLAAVGVSCMPGRIATADFLLALRTIAGGTPLHVFDTSGEGRASVLGPVDLTEREREVLELVARRRSHRRIAEALHISSETARTHTANIRRKLGVRSNRDLWLD